MRITNDIGQMRLWTLRAGRGFVFMGADRCRRSAPAHGAQFATSRLVSEAGHVGVAQADRVGSSRRQSSTTTDPTSTFAFPDSSLFVSPRTAPHRSRSCLRSRCRTPRSRRCAAADQPRSRSRRRTRRSRARDTAGQVVEERPARDALTTPTHSYTRQLLVAIPTPASRTFRCRPSGSRLARNCPSPRR